jgi:hypothetical protein
VLPYGPKGTDEISSIALPVTHARPKGTDPDAGKRSVVRHGCGPARAIPAAHESLGRRWRPERVECSCRTNGPNVVGTRARDCSMFSIQVRRRLTLAFEPTLAVEARDASTLSDGPNVVRTGAPDAPTIEGGPAVHSRPRLAVEVDRDPGRPGRPNVPWACWMVATNSRPGALF